MSRALGLIAVACLVGTTQNTAATTFKVLHSFTASEGSKPIGEPVLDSAGHIYGTTYAGGPTDQGTLFKLSLPSTGTTYVLTTLHAFTSGSEGSQPSGDLSGDSDGNLFGTAQYGGASGVGSAFAWDPQLGLSILHDFIGGSDGTLPIGGLTRAGNGTFYGTASTATNDSCETSNPCGVLYSISPSGQFTVIHNFTAGSNGYHPASRLIRVGAMLYGTTIGSFTQPTVGYGPFSVNSDGSNFSQMNAKCPSSVYAGLTVGPDGQIYGVGETGGNRGFGAIFTYSPNIGCTLVHNFGGAGGGFYPTGTLVLGSGGISYGTTNGNGGFGSNGKGPGGYGNVFAFDPTKNSVRVIHTFTGADGENPASGLVIDSSGNLFGVTPFGGAAGRGVVFEITP